LLSIYARPLRNIPVLFVQVSKYNISMENKVYKNASIVTGLSVAERGLGFLYRVVLSRLIGAEGLGLYQVALSLFSLFLTVGTGGIPITVSRMISKCKANGDTAGERRVVGAGLCACLLLTLPVALLLAIFGKNFTFLFSDSRCFNLFKILLIGLCFSSIYAVLRGSFWGNKEFLLPSIVEIAEETVMVIAGVLLLQNVSSPLNGAEKAVWAVVLSYLFSFSLAILLFFLRGYKISKPKKELKSLFTSSLPITSVRAGGSLINSAIAVLLPVMLIRSGMGESDAFALFGVLSGMVLPLLFIPSTLIGSLSLVLVPELSEDYYRGNYTHLYTNLRRGIKFSFLIACAILPFFFTLGYDLGALAFSNLTAGEMISYSAPILLPMSLTMITTSMLNSLGFEKQTFLVYFFSAAILLLCVLLLPALCGGYAYLIGLGASFSVNALCNFLFLLKKCPLYQNRGKQVFLREFLPHLLAVLPLSLLGYFTHGLLARFFSTPLALFTTTFVLLLATCALYFVTGALRFEALKKFLPAKRRERRKTGDF